MQQSLQVRPAVPAPGQATRIEQSRAEAEVLAAVMAAKQFPRNVESARAAMQMACRQRSLADEAFFDFNRGDGSVRGETIHLAKELALIWGNLDFGVMELSRDDAAGRSEVLAFAKDLERNTRSSAIFISPHRRDAGGRQKDLASLRDVYENNANMGARRLREAIWAVLPRWFRAEAAAICRETLAQGRPNQTLPQRIEELVATYARVGVPVALLESKAGRKKSQWGEPEVVDLEITFRSVERGDINRDEAFPPPRVTVEEATKSPAPAVVAGPPAPDAPVEPEPTTPPETIWDRIAKARVAKGWSEEQAEAEFTAWSDGEEIGSVADAQLERFIAHMSGGAA